MYRRLAALLASPKFFYAVVALFVLQAGWIALSGNYPLAFDEDFHLGIIRLYAHHLSPFWSSQPAHADMFGAVYRDPSYLYHYLMSFPYRLIALVVHGQTAQIIALRFLNIALLATSLALYRRLLLTLGVGSRLTHVMLALFVLIPIVPFLGAQINYDNLFIPLTALNLLLAAQIILGLKCHKRLDIQKLTLLLIIGLLTTLVKYAFLPILVVLLLLVLVQTFLAAGSWRKFWFTAGFGITLITKPTRWLLLVGIIIALGLCGERYGVNLARYHKLVPDCDKVLSTMACSAYAPWQRDHALAQAPKGQLDGPLGYMDDWFYGMWLRTFFAVDGPATNFETRGPLIVPALSAVILAAVGAVCFLVRFHKILRRYQAATLWLFIAAIGLYVGILWVDEYQAYRQTGQPVALNGRYLLPIMPLLMALLALGYAELLRRRPRLLLTIATVAVISFAWGGGTLTYILRSRSEWYWQNSAVESANSHIQNAIRPVVPGAQNPIQFLR